MSDTLKAAIEKHGLSVRSEFVPWSQSRNKGEKHRSLNWRVTLIHNGRDILTTDYSAGIAHCPAYKWAGKGQPFGRMSVDGAKAIEHETETGRQARTMGSLPVTLNGKPILPNPVDVLASLILDSDVLNSSSFEEWARDLGYDPDSRSAERIYRQCLEIALRLRNGIGEQALAELREAASDY